MPIPVKIERARSAVRQHLFFLAFAALAAAIAFVYWDVLDAPFLPWDDDYNLWKNPFIAMGGWWKLWLQPFYGMYVPVTSSVWAALYAIGEAQSWPFRLANDVFHFANACLVFKLVEGWLSRLRSPSKAAAFAGAALFALHPLQVGSVAWVSDLRGILGAFFGLSATLVFFRWESRRATIGSFALFALGLLSKPGIVALPAALVVAQWALDPARAKLAFVRLLPWFGASLAAAAITKGAQDAVLEWSVPFWMRPAIVADSYGFYLIKTAFPYALSVDYGRQPWTIQENIVDSLPTIAACAVSLAASIWMARRNRKWSIAICWFILLSPTSGAVDFGFQQISTVADHYNYAPLAVVAALVAMGLQPFLASPNPTRSRAAWAAFAALALAFAGVSRVRTEAWIGEPAFFSDMVEKNPRSYSALIGLANMLCMSPNPADIEKGLAFARRATEARTQDPVSVADVAVCLIRLGRLQETLALESHLDHPDFVRRLKRHDFAASSFFTSLGGVAFHLGQIDKGFAYVCEAVHSNAMSQPSRQQIEQMQRQLASANRPARDCGPPRGIDGVISHVKAIAMAGHR